jgi:hypothetical protein
LITKLHSGSLLERKTPPPTAAARQYSQHLPRAGGEAVQALVALQQASPRGQAAAAMVLRLPSRAIVVTVSVVRQV